jgi:uncharacterized protein (DUF342 family)
MLDFKEFIGWLFYGGMGLIALYISSSISKMRSSIEHLNITFGVEIEKLSNVKDRMEKHERTLERHSDRLLELEKKIHLKKGDL